MILEGIVTTLDVDGRCNIAPMGPRVEAEMLRFTLRPFRTSTTYRNLKRSGEGVLHVTDDALLLARAAIGKLRPEDAPTRPAEVVDGRILVDACRYYEFKISECDDRDERATLTATMVAEGRIRDFFGFNRARHAVVEAAILATRVAILPIDAIREELRRLSIPVEKTGGDREREAMALLCEYIEDHAHERAATARGDE